MTSHLGLSTYAYFWRMSDRVPHPMSLDDALRDTAAHGVTLFQICDHPPLDSASDDRLADIRALASSLGITLEVGTRGTEEQHLLRYLHIAQRLGAGLVRSMWTSGEDRPDRTETVRRLRSVMPEYERAGVTLALETYEQVSSTELVATVEAVGSPRLGICLDPANTVANLELPADVVQRCAPYARNWHVKDFDFTRSPGWVGFQYTGVPFGAGRLAYDEVRQALLPDERGINQIIEFWLPWAGNAAETTRTEKEWIDQTIKAIRAKTGSP